MMDSLKVEEAGGSPILDLHKMRPSYMEILSHPIPSLFDQNVCKSLESQFIAEEDVEEEEVAEPIKTYLRIRPYYKRDEDEFDVIEIKDEKTVISNTILPGIKGTKIPKKTEYKFSKVLDPSCSQQQVFDQAIAPLMERFDKGENCLVFSYGASNSGKTFTMQGTTQKFGIIPRTLDYVFNRLQYRVYHGADIQPFMHESTRSLPLEEQQIILDKKVSLISYAAKQNEMKSRPSLAYSEQSSHCGSLKYIAGGALNEGDYHSTEGTNIFSMWVSFFEMYNEKCYDLLDGPEMKNKGKRRVIKVVSDKGGNAYMKDLTEIPVYNEEEAFGVYVAGTKRLQMGSTQINQSSSRSHCFFTIRVVELGVMKCNVFPIKMHRITFCDLAGMERVSQTENTGDQLRESANINHSLLSLLKVIRMIREKQINGSAGQSFLEKIPFRDSQLTRIFRGYFTSSTHIAMIVNVNPNPAMIESSTLTLQNSAIASNIIAFRQTIAPKIIVEDYQLNSSFLHSSRDIEDILEEEEEPVENNNQTKITIPPAWKKPQVKPLEKIKNSRSKRQEVLQKAKGNNRFDNSKDHKKKNKPVKKPSPLGGGMSESSDNDKENEIAYDDYSTKVDAALFFKLQEDLELERLENLALRQEIHFKDQENKKLKIKVNTIEQETREATTRLFVEGVNRNDFAKDQFEKTQKALEMSEKRVNEFHRRILFSQNNKTTASTQTD